MRVFYCLIMFVFLVFNMDAALAIVSVEDMVKIKKLEDYFNKMKSLKAVFHQTDVNGSLSEGRFFLQRPGRMRIEYIRPDQKLIVADGQWFIYHDPVMEETTRIPLDSSPANIILKNHVSFSEGVTVLDFSDEDKDTVEVTLARNDEPGMGSLTLTFKREPLTLLQWIVHNPQGGDTVVKISSVKTSDKQLPPELFRFDRLRF